VIRKYAGELTTTRLDSTRLTEINSKEENSFRFREESLNKIYLRGKSSKKNVYTIYSWEWERR